MYRFEGN